MTWEWCFYGKKHRKEGKTLNMISLSFRKDSWALKKKSRALEVVTNVLLLCLALFKWEQGTRESSSPDKDSSQTSWDCTQAPFFGFIPRNNKLKITSMKGQNTSYRAEPMGMWNLLFPSPSQAPEGSYLSRGASVAREQGWIYFLRCFHSAAICCKTCRNLSVL